MELVGLEQSSIKTHVFLGPKLKNTIHVIQVFVQIELPPFPVRIGTPIPRQNGSDTRVELLLALERPSIVGEMEIAESVVIPLATSMRQGDDFPAAKGLETAIRYARLGTDAEV